MCSIEEPVLLKEKSIVTKCAKCRVSDPVVNVRQTNYCKPCFILNFSHKYRITLGRHKNTERKERVLVAFSGGASSRALLHQIMEPKREDAQRKNLNQYVVCHIDQSIVEHEASAIYSIAKMQEIVHSYDLQFIVCEINSYPIDQSSFIETYSSFKTLTSRHDYLTATRLKLLAKIAKDENCSSIYFGDSASRTAVNIIAKTSKGRGYSLAAETDSHQIYNCILLCRPFKEHLDKEIAFYNHFNQLESCIIRINESKVSIDRLVLNFITCLEKGFSSTVNTVARTGAKLVSESTSDVLCTICNAPVQGNCSEWRNRVIMYSLKNETFEHRSDLCYGCQILEIEKIQ